MIVIRYSFAWILGFGLSFAIVIPELSADPRLGMSIAPEPKGIVTGRSTVTADIRIHGDLAPWTPVAFALDGLGTLEITQTQTGSSGRAATIFVPPIGQSGTSTITATAIVDGDTITDLLTVNYEGRGFYGIVDLGNPLNITAPNSLVSTLRLNNHGEVVLRQYILREGQAPETLPLYSPFTFVVGYDIADDGTVIGIAQNTTGASAAIFKDGTIHTLPHLINIASGANYIGARAINSHGTIVGGSLTPVPYKPPGEPVTTSEGLHATQWQDGSPSSLVEFPSVASVHSWSGGSSIAFGINDAGLIVGEFTGGFEFPDTDLLARVWYGGGSSTPLPALASTRWLRSTAYAINNHNAIAGTAASEITGQSHPVLWLLSPAHGLGAGQHRLSQDAGVANDINDAGQVVGRLSQGVFPNDGYPYHGFFWENGDLRNLNDLIDPDSLYHILEATRVNENGQIACWANLKNDPQRYAVLLLSPAE